jgi:hypothetical protein
MSPFFCLQCQSKIIQLYWWYDFFGKRKYISILLKQFSNFYVWGTCWFVPIISATGELEFRKITVWSLARQKLARSHLKLNMVAHIYNPGRHKHMERSLKLALAKTVGPYLKNSQNKMSSCRHLLRIKQSLFKKYFRGNPLLGPCLPGESSCFFSLALINSMLWRLPPKKKNWGKDCYIQTLY